MCLELLHFHFQNFFQINLSQHTENHFYELIFEADTIDYLKLKRPNHQRAYFERKDQKWEGSFVAP